MWDRPHTTLSPQSPKCCGWETPGLVHGKILFTGSSSLLVLHLPPAITTFLKHISSDVIPLVTPSMVLSESLILLLRFSKIVLAPGSHSLPSCHTIILRLLHQLFPGLYPGCLYFPFLASPLLSKSCPSFQPNCKGYLPFSSLPYSPTWPQLFPALLYGLPSSSCIPWRTATAPCYLRSDPQTLSLGLACFRGGTLKGRGRRNVKGSGIHTKKGRGEHEGAQGADHRAESWWLSFTCFWAFIFHHGIICYLNPLFLSPSSSSFLPLFLFSLLPSFLLEHSFFKKGAVTLLPRGWKLILRIWKKN